MENNFVVKYYQANQILDALIVLSHLPAGKKLLEYKDPEDHFQFTDAHVYTSFRKLRKALLDRGKVLLCKGCRTDTHPLSHQLKWIYANKFVLGKRVEPDKDKVMIFDEELDMDKLGSIAEQDEFYGKWFDSIQEVPY